MNRFSGQICKKHRHSKSQLVAQKTSVQGKKMDYDFFPIILEIESGDISILTSISSGIGIHTEKTYVFKEFSDDDDWSK